MSIALLKELGLKTKHWVKQMQSTFARFTIMNIARKKLGSRQAIFLRRYLELLFFCCCCFKGVKVSVQKPVDAAAQGRDNLARTLYSRLFSWIVLKLNSCLKENEKVDR